LSPSRVTRDNFLWQTNFVFVSRSATNRNRAKGEIVGILGGKGNEKVLNISQKL